MEPIASAKRLIAYVLFIDFVAQTFKTIGEGGWGGGGKG